MQIQGPFWKWDPRARWCWRQRAETAGRWCPGFSLPGFDTLAQGGQGGGGDLRVSPSQLRAPRTQRSVSRTPRARVVSSRSYLRVGSMLIVFELQATTGVHSRKRPHATGPAPPWAPGSHSHAGQGHAEAAHAPRRSPRPGCPCRGSRSRGEGGHACGFAGGKGARPSVQRQAASDSLARPTSAGGARPRACPGPGSCRAARPLPWEPARPAAVRRPHRGDRRPRRFHLHRRGMRRAGSSSRPQWELVVSILRSSAAHRPLPGAKDQHAREASTRSPVGDSRPRDGAQGRRQRLFRFGLVLGPLRTRLSVCKASDSEGHRARPGSTMGSGECWPPRAGPCSVRRRGAARGRCGPASQGEVGPSGVYRAPGRGFLRLPVCHSLPCPSHRLLRR